MAKNINPEMRVKILQKIKDLHPRLGLSASPEMLENACHIKSNNDYKTYVELIKNLMSRSKQQQQQHGQMVPGYPQSSMGISTNNNSNSDPLNALQNLTVSAGQTGQSVTQQQQQPTNMNIRISPTIYNAQIRQRPSGPANIVKPMVNIQGHQGHSSTSGHLSTSNVPRQANKSVVIKGDMGQLSSSQGTPFSLDSCDHTPISSQSMYNQTFSLAHPTKVYHASSSQLPMKSVPTISTTNPPGESTRSNLTMATANKQPVIITEDEMKIVSDEIKRLKEKYLKILKSILEMQKKFGDDDVKIWKVLKNVLENPDGISKPLSMKHIVKMEQHLVKVERLLAGETSAVEMGRGLPGNIQMVQVIDPARQVPVATITTNRRAPVPSDRSTNQKIRLEPASNTESLDVAFEEVCHQLSNSNHEVLKQIQKSLVKYVDSKRHLFSRLLPKRLLLEDSEDDESGGASKRQRRVSIFDEEEFNFLDDKDAAGAAKKRCEAVERNVSIEGSFVQTDLEGELVLLSNEFDIEPIPDGEVMSDKWCTYDSEWDDNGFFYSISLKSKMLPDPVPPIKVRIPGDYLHSGCVDWNLNEDLYAVDCSAFLRDVKDRMEHTFSKIHQCLQWFGVSLDYVANAYKETILAVISETPTNGSATAETDP